MTSIELPPLAAAQRTARLLRRVVLGLAIGIALLGAPLLAAPWLPGNPVLLELRRAGIVALPLAALLAALAGTIGAWVVAWARQRAALPALALSNPLLIGRAARWPQVALVSLPAIGGAALGLLLRGEAGLPAAPPSAAWFLAGAALILAFPLLIAERSLAAQSPQRLPEAPALRALAFLAVAALFAAGLAEIASGLGFRYAERVAAFLALLPALVSTELALRALGRCFLPPPEPQAARGAAESLLARLVAEGVGSGSLIAPVKQHFGIDFERSWALAYVARIAAPIALLLLLLCWGLTGIVLVGLEHRAVYERLGVPVAVLQPGLHAILPWPLGQVRRLELGTVHEIALAQRDGAMPPERVGAEDPAPPSADRLWEQAHPDEVSFLIASESSGRQNFQIVSADIRVLYRIGTDDDSALRAVYGAADPVTLLRGAAGRAVAGFFAGSALEAALGENREAMAEDLRHAMQRDLDRAACGIELAAVIIEAIHPPPGAADAYHNVQAAQIEAEASISIERGRALASRSAAQQYATSLVTQAAGGAAETIADAKAAAMRFAADRDASAAGGRSFLLERYLDDLAAGFGKAALTIVDHRIPSGDTPVFDLRPPGAAARGAPGTGTGME